MNTVKQLILETPEIATGIQEVRREFEKYELACLHRQPEIFPAETARHLEARIAKASPSEREQLRGELVKLTGPGAEAAKIAASTELHRAFQVVAGRLEGLRLCCESVALGLLYKAVADEAELAGRWHITDPKQLRGPSVLVADVIEQLAKLRPRAPQHLPGTVPALPSPNPGSHPLARWFGL